MKIIDRLRAGLWQLLAGASGLFGLLSLGSVHEQHMAGGEANPLHLLLALGFGIGAALEWARRRVVRRGNQAPTDVTPVRQTAGAAILRVAGTTPSKPEQVDT